jgi:hypothetical protein
VGDDLSARLGPPIPKSPLNLNKKYRVRDHVAVAIPPAREPDQDQVTSRGGMTLRLEPSGIGECGPLRLEQIGVAFAIPYA